MYCQKGSIPQGYHLPGPQEGSKERLSLWHWVCTHCSSRLPAAVARRLAFIEGKETHEHARKKQTTTKETITKGQGAPRRAGLSPSVTPTAQSQPPDGCPLHFVQGFRLSLAGRWHGTCLFLLIWNQKLFKSIISSGLSHV